MDELKYNGRTRSEWLALKDTNGGNWVGVSQEKVHQALLWFENEDKKSHQETEERRFQTQLDESRRQGSATRRIAYFAVGVSVISVLAGIWMHFHPIAVAPATTSSPIASPTPSPTPKP